MDVSFSRPADAEEIADIAPVFTRVMPAPRADFTSGGRYGDARPIDWRGVAAIVLLHALALFAAIHFDLVPLPRHKPEPVMVTLIPDQIAPPPLVQAAPPPERIPPPDAPPPPPQLITTAAITPAPTLTVAPQPEPVPPPAPPKAVAAPVAPPIVPPDASAAMRTNPSPTYPLESRRHREQGAVRLRVTVSAEGRVEEVAVARTSGFDRLDRAAIDAVRRWKFAPGTQAGVAIEAFGFVTIPFQLT